MTAVNAASDVDVVIAMRTARQVFSDGILREAGTDRRDHRQRLKSDSVFQIAEFFFLLESHGIRTDMQVREFARLHNEYLAEIITSPEKLERLERTRSQVDGASFSEIGIDKLVENFLRKPPSFDQSDLCRFLVTQQSFENCRRSLKVLRDVGLLDETRIAYGSIVLHSGGVLEQVYRNHVDSLRGRLLTGTQETGHD